MHLRAARDSVARPYADSSASANRPAERPMTGPPPSHLILSGKPAITQAGNGGAGEAPRRSFANR